MNSCQVRLAFLLPAILLLSCDLGFTEEQPAEEFFSMMEQVGKVSVANKLPTDVREAPAIVSVITEDDLRNSGARDLKDALTLLVPGFHFGKDVNNVQSIGFRGIDGEEGRVLVLVDGLETNERVFGTTQFDNRYPIDQIERIEIMRGPGSVIYGGFAELAVISITTKGAKSNQAYATATDSEMSRTYSHRGGTVGFGKTYGDFSGSFNGTFMQGHYAQRVGTDFNGLSMDMAPWAKNELANGDLALAYKGLQFRTYLDEYVVWNRDNVSDFYTGPDPYKTYFRENIYELKYDYKGIENLVITPRLEYKRDAPWVMDITPANTPALAFTEHQTSEKDTAGLTASWDTTDKLNLLGGFEIYKSYLFDGPQTGIEIDNPLPNGGTSDSFVDVATFGQASLKTNVVNLTAGFRWDKTSQFGGAAVPRVALTKVMGPANAKLIYSQSFRIPVGDDVALTLPGSPRIVPEKATNYEAEFGYQLFKELSAVIDAYDIAIHDPIVFNYTANPGYFTNYSRIRSRGIQPELRYRSHRWDLTANYSYYYASSDVPSYGDYANAPKGLLYAAPAHEVNVFARIGVISNLSFNPSMHYISKRYGNFSALSSQPSQSIPEVAIWGFNIRAVDFWKKGTEADFGIQDIFNQGLDTPPEYYNAESGIPGLSRAYVVKLGYKFGI